MKMPLKSRVRLSLDEAVRIATETAPRLPPARLANGDKQVICRALAGAGIEVAPADLEDRTPRRRAA